MVAAPARAWLFPNSSNANATTTTGGGGEEEEDAARSSTTHAMLTDAAECAEGITARLRVATLAALARVARAAAADETEALTNAGVDVAVLAPRWLDLLADFAAVAAMGGPRACGVDAARRARLMTHRSSSNAAADADDDDDDARARARVFSRDGNGCAPRLGLVPAALRARGVVFADLAAAWPDVLDALTAAIAGEAAAGVRARGVAVAVATPRGCVAFVLAFARMALTRSLSLRSRDDDDGGNGGGGGALAAPLNPRRGGRRRRPRARRAERRAGRTRDPSGATNDRGGGEGGGG